MLRLKRTLVQSFVGAIALGWIFSQAVVHLAYVFSAPIAGWLSRREYQRFADHAIGQTRFFMQDSLPELVKAVSLLLLGYLLLRWLYFNPEAVAHNAADREGASTESAKVEV